MTSSCSSKSIVELDPPCTLPVLPGTVRVRTTGDRLSDGEACQTREHLAPHPLLSSLPRVVSIGAVRRLQLRRQSGADYGSRTAVHSPVSVAALALATGEPWPAGAKALTTSPSLPYIHRTHRFLTPPQLMAVKDRRGWR